MPSNTKRKKRFRQEAIFIVVVLVALGFGVFKYVQHLAERDLLKVSFELSDGSKTEQFSMHVASTPSEREQGLMFKKDGFLAPHQGMIFIFPKSEEQSFWMRNTYISLDMIFVDTNHKVVGVLKNIPTLNKKPRTVGKPSLFVLEFLAGTADRIGITEGARLKFHGPLPRAI